MVNPISQKLATAIEKHPRLKQFLMAFEGPINLIYHLALGFLIGITLLYVVRQI